MLQEIIKRTLRVPIEKTNTPGNGEQSARQVDVALMRVGFKLSKDLLIHLSSQHPAYVEEIGRTILNAVRELVGDHIQHNVYFINFPRGVPDTFEFWMEEIFRLWYTGETKYGRYQHSYQEMLALHDEFIPSVKDTMKVLHLGKTLTEETLDLYYSLAESNVPLNVTDRQLVKKLAQVCLTDPQPEIIPMRETKAIINAVRMDSGMDVFVDTLTDILRLACALSEGDVTLQEPTKFISFSRATRSTLMTLLDSKYQLADIHQYREQWKRLGERLHPHEYPDRHHALDVFAVARGDRNARTVEGKVEVALAEGNIRGAITILSSKPGAFIRSVDRFTRLVSEEDMPFFLECTQKALGKASGRVILSLCEHIQNRENQRKSRIFTNSKGKAWVTEDSLIPLAKNRIEQIIACLDDEIRRRLPTFANLSVEHAVMDVALPLSEKNKASGFAVMPRGSMMSLENGIVRFFVYWKQAWKRTDYDLSALILDNQFQYKDHLSYTQLRTLGGVHSGDLTHAEDGATEFIDIDLNKVQGQYIIPTIYIYAGEEFTEVESCFFGVMERTEEQMGRPFEPTTVKIKSDVRGTGKVAMPLAFVKDERGKWSAKWMHLYAKGQPNFNRIETNHLTTSVLTRSIVDRQYLSVSYLVDLMKQKGFRSIENHPEAFIGLEVPEGLPEGTKTYTLNNLHEIIPA